MSEEKTAYAAMPIAKIGTPCLICGESVEIEWHARAPKICDKCKAAVMHVRKKLEDA